VGLSLSCWLVVYINFMEFISSTKLEDGKSNFHKDKLNELTVALKFYCNAYSFVFTINVLLFTIFAQ